MKVYIGIDWSQNKHDLCVLNQAGACLAQLVIAHSQRGFWQIEEMRNKLGAAKQDCLVGLETAHNILIDFLWDQGYEQVFVLPPSLVKGSRSRFGQSGARSDISDALLIADILRTDQGRLHAWQPDSGLTRQIRMRVNYTRFLTVNLVRLTNRQRAVLNRYYPAVVDLFSNLHTLIAQRFIQTFPTPQAAAKLDLSGFQAFAHQNRYHYLQRLPGMLAKLQQAYPEADPQIVQACEPQASSLATLFLEMLKSKQANLKELQKLLDQHPDQGIYTSLPGTGVYLQSALLSSLGDDRQRFPSASRIQALAGTCPVTISSGKRKRVQFRKACDHEFRHVVQQWAKLSLRSSVWANAYYQQIRPHCQSESHAFRCLANRWLAILWRLWQDQVHYDEVYHSQQRTIKSQPLMN